MYRKFKKRQIQNNVHHPQSLNPLNDMVKAESIVYSANVKNVLGKINKLETLHKTGKMDFTLIRYILGLADVARPGQIYSLNVKRKYGYETYKDKNTLEFNTNLNTNTYTNFNSMHICLPIK